MNIKFTNGNLNLSNRALPFLLCLLMLFNVCGYSVWFNIAQNRIRREIRAQIRQGLEEKDLSVIEVEKGRESGIKWLERGKEFIYHGEMYDVVRMESLGNKQVYHCIQDVKEKKLIADFARNHDSSQKARRLLSYYQFNFINNPQVQLNIPIVLKYEYGSSPFDICSNPTEISDPPPKA